MSLRQVRARPALWVDDAFATPAACADLARVCADWDRIRALGAQPSHDETGFSWEVPRSAHPAVAAVAASMEAALGFPDALGGTLRYRRYSTGEGHPPHLDTYTVGGRTLVATAMLVLQAPEAGGATRFPRASPNPVEVRARTGRLVVWANHLPDGAPDPDSAHAGQTVERGQKVTLTLFAYAADPTTRPVVLR